MDYRERIADLVDMQRRETASGLYFDWLYTTKRRLIADTYGKTELQVDADVRALLESREVGQ
jgi:hypothetical protein